MNESVVSCIYMHCSTGRCLRRKSTGSHELLQWAVGLQQRRRGLFGLDADLVARAHACSYRRSAGPGYVSVSEPKTADGGKEEEHVIQRDLIYKNPQRLSVPRSQRALTLHTQRPDGGVKYSRPATQRSGTGNEQVYQFNHVRYPTAEAARARRQLAN